MIMTEINLEDSEKSIHYKVNQSEEIQLYPRELNDLNWEKKIDFEIVASDIKSKIVYRCVARKNTNLDMTFRLYTSNKKVDNLEINLEIHILNLSEENNINVRPFLEIPKENISFEHKVTIGAPSKDWLKYLNSRGLNNQISTELIVNSFLNNC